MNADRTSILVVDDEPDLLNLLAFNLRHAGFDVDAVGSGEEALCAVRLRDYAVVVLDLMLPDLSGTEVCRRIRAEAHLAEVAIMMLTAKDEEHDRVTGYEVGTDDYVAKPFEVAEVVSRVRALALCADERRRARALRLAGDRFRWRGLEVDPSSHRAFADGSEITLTPQELRLLLLFFENPGRLITRNQMLGALWAHRAYREERPLIGNTIRVSVATTRSVDKQVRRLRERLGAYGEIIETSQGRGYKLRDAAG